MSRTITMLAAVAIFASAGCSNKKLIAQKDAEIADLQSDVARLQSEVAQQKRMTGELESKLKDLRDEKRVWLEEKGNLTHITLDGAATFRTASAQLSAEGKRIIDRLWDVIQKYPDRSLLIEGHADARPIAPALHWKYPSNWELSSARAHAVLHYLSKKHKVDATRLAAIGYGDAHPIASNSTPDGQAQNRRVVITVGSAKDVQARVISRESGEPKHAGEGGR